MYKTLICLIFLFFSSLYTFASSTIDKTDEIDLIIDEMILEIRHSNQAYYLFIVSKEQELNQVNQSLLHANSVEEKVDLLLHKEQLKEDLLQLQQNSIAEVSRIRYLKGLQIIRILYEKVLSLDHHFASVRTFSEINKIANPNQYPEFKKVQDIIQNKKDKKAGFDLTSLLGTNTVVSVLNTFSNMMLSGLSKEEKESELKSIECIIDFTLRMQGDLNTIYFETAFLHKSNDKIKEDLETLFREYTKPINYLVTLEACRSNDDWETVRKQTSTYMLKLNESSDVEQTKMHINIEFPIDRLMQFITQYNNFIDQGGKFYEKFKIILNSYENEEQCQTQLPLEYQKLKSDIDVAIDKFNIAYKPVEINGSKMKEILYGINEYD